MDSQGPNPHQWDDFMAEFTRKIIIIDDDPDIQILVKSVVEQMKGEKKTILFDCLVASDGPEGLAVIERERPDLIVLDVRMPGMTGLEVLEKLRQFEDSKLANTPVLMLTAKSDADTVIQATRKGAHSYLLKPFQKEELISRIQRLLDV